MNNFYNIINYVIFVIAMTLIVTPIASAYGSISYITMNDKPLAKYEQTSDSSELVFYQTDNLGNIRSEFTLDGTLRDVVDYLPFGGQPDGSGQLTGNIGYQSMVFDFVTNLYSMYDPEQGRYLVPDTGYTKTDSQTFSPYVFQRANPFRKVDSAFEAPGLKIQNRQDGVEGSSVNSGVNRGAKLNLQLEFVAYDPSALIATGRAIGAHIGNAVKERRNRPKESPPDKVGVPAEQEEGKVINDEIDIEALKDALPLDMEPIYEGHHLTEVVQQWAHANGIEYDNIHNVVEDFISHNDFTRVDLPGGGYMVKEFFSTPGQSGVIDIPPSYGGGSFTLTCSTDQYGNCPS